MKKTIQINYDLVAPGRDYKPLYDYIKSFDGWCHLLESQWLVRTTMSASEVRDELMELVDGNDKIVTFDVTGDYWATNFSDSKTDWLHGHMGTLLAA